MFKDEKKKVLLSTDVFIMTSRFEGLPMGMIEALSYGLPCIATVGTNLSEEIAQYDAGWTASNDVGSIRKALRDMLRDKDELAKKGENAVRLADTYSWDAIAKKATRYISRSSRCDKHTGISERCCNNEEEKEDIAYFLRRFGPRRSVRSDLFHRGASSR